MTKRRVLACIGYCGFGLKGSQLQTHHSHAYTVEGVMAKRLVQNGLVKEINFLNPANMGFERSSRTDKGVHSVANFISFKAELDVDKMDYIKSGTFLSFVTQALNSKQPLRDDIQKLAVSAEQIQKNHERGKEIYEKFAEIVPNTSDPQLAAFHLTITPKRFNPRHNALVRGYEYVLPFDIITSLISKFDSSGNNISDLMVSSGLNTSSIMDNNEKLKLASTICEKLNIILNQYQGSHSFHNFTVKGENNDAFERLIFHCYARPKLITADGIAHIVVKIKISGNGFLQHQIRKMISSSILNLIAPEIVDQEYVNIALHTKQKIYLSKVPGEHLIHTKTILFDEEIERIYVNNCREKQIAYKNDILYPEILNNHKDYLEETWAMYANEIIDYGHEWLEGKDKVKQQAAEEIEKAKERSTEKAKREITIRKKLLEQGSPLNEDKIFPRGYRAHFYVKFKVYPTDSRAVKALETLVEWTLNKKIDLYTDYEPLDEIVVAEGLLNPSNMCPDDEEL